MIEYITENDNLKSVIEFWVVDEKGKLEGIYGGPSGIEKVKTKTHADQVIKFWELKL